jgi:PAS domain S-box-containing protein
VQDVTERRLLVDELRASEQRYRRLIDALSEGVLLIDPDGRIRLANAHMGAMLGATADDIVGQSAFRFLEEGEHDTARERLAQRTRGIGGRYLSRIVRKDGVSIPVSCRVDPVLDAEGRCEGMVTIVQDLSERHAAEEVRGQLARTEEQLRHSQKMEAVGLLAGGVAHDFNNLLSIVLSYAELLRDGLEPDDPRRADADEIRNAGEKAASLTRQLLAFSRKQVLQPRVMDLNETILGMQKMLRRLLGEDVELTLLPAERLGRVHADPCHIEQVVMNLAVNARDAMPRGGELTMRTENVALDPDEASSLGLPPGAYVCLSVEDDGCGMDAATRERIFEPFFTTKKEGCGTGLGLSTVFGIVRQSGGQVAVRSEPGHGATFRVYLPRRDASASLPCNTLPGDAGLEGTETILLVEDDEQVRRVVGAALRRRGYTLLQAQNAGEAMLVAERHDGPIHLLLTDVVMPVVSGRELAERLVPLIHGLRVLFMSGYTPDAVLRHGVREGSAAFVQKPVTPQLLAAKVREVLRIPVDQAAE